MKGNFVDYWPVWQRLCRQFGEQHLIRMMETLHIDRIDRFTWALAAWVRAEEAKAKSESGLPELDVKGVSSQRWRWMSDDERGAEIHKALVKWLERHPRQAQEIRKQITRRYFQSPLESERD
jgi:hypothetical protein